MNVIFSLLMVSGLVTELVTKGGDAALSSLIAGAGDAVSLMMSFAGAYLLWMGLIGLMRASGLMDLLSRGMRPLIRWLFPRASAAAMGAIALNLAANFLGMGNAATPFGIEAMRALDLNNPQPGVLSHEMCLFLCLNATAIELVPSGLLTMRQAAGSLAPAVIVMPTLIASLAATAVAVLLCRMLEKARKKAGGARC